MKKIVSIFISLSLSLFSLQINCYERAVIFKNDDPNNSISKIILFGSVMDNKYTDTLQGPIAPNQETTWHWKSRTLCSPETMLGKNCYNLPSFMVSQTLTQIDVYQEGQVKPITTTGKWKPDTNFYFVVGADGKAIPK